MQRIATEHPEVFLFEPKVFGDERGFFQESWNARVFSDLGVDVEWVQDNHSRSSQGVLRGLHLQRQQPQDKLVRVVAGSVFDVAVDVRRGSPHFGRWVGVELSAENHRQLFVPKGFAHGFLVTSERADFLYKCSDFYDPSSELSLRWDDPEIGIQWPLDGLVPTLSGKDEAGFTLSSVPQEYLPDFADKS